MRQAMPARCRHSARVRPPMPAPTMMTPSRSMSAGALFRLEEFLAARNADPALVVVHAIGRGDLAVLRDDDAQGASAVVEADETGGRRCADRGCPAEFGGSIEKFGALSPGAVLVEEIARRHADDALVDDALNCVVFLEDAAGGKSGQQ